MSNSTIFEMNKACIDRRIHQGIELLKEYYKLIPIEIKEFGQLKIQDMDYVVSQYEIRHVGNLVIMVCPESERMQMDSFVLTPYYKNLPMFSTDYIYTKENRFFLNEIYTLTENEDLLYQLYMERFKAIKEYHKHLPDASVKSCWYDKIRPVCIAKTTTPEEDDEILEIFLENLRTWIAMERYTPFLTDYQYKLKWKKTKEYTDALVDEGGVSTDVFKTTLGAEKTRLFFDEVFFAPRIYQK